MTKKKISTIEIFLIAVAFAVVLQIGSINAVGEATFCCEKTIDSNPSVQGNQPAWCQNSNEEIKCDAANGLRVAPTSCEATSYCKLGTCVNNQEGLCVENTPEATCNPDEGGTWYDSPSSEIPQCQLGCCLIGEQAAFTTQTRCKQLSSVYGLETNYRADIQSEVECIETAGPEAKGACVFEEEFQRTCNFATRKECQVIGTSKSLPTEFHEGFLCSNEALGTNCGMSQKTKVADGRDEVFFVDTCGNLANIYDSTRATDQTYWDEIVSKAESCVLDGDLGNANECGNCDYLAGSTGKLYDRNIDGTAAQPIGDYICRDLNCRGYVGESYTKGNPPNHGETWCAYSPDSGNARGISQIKVDNAGNLKSTGIDSPGGRYFRKVCYNGEVTVESCADFRQEVCLQSDVNGFATAACRVNKWQDCGSQNDAKDCLNIDVRDCKWVSETGVYTSLGNNNQILPSEGECVPRFAPGFDFWSSSTDAGSLCSIANERCVVEYESRFQGSNAIERVVGAATYFLNKVTRNKELLETDIKGKVTCLGDNGDIRTEWLDIKRNQCISLGDCGISVNYIGTRGSGQGDAIKVENEK